ncbi:DUF2313 domain-containing protein [Heyndrickxia oleronia]|uniref:putative phage tail protein n=1 Tax=Heyndrickxia oleronia TaxID=38875 RepID=UPI00333D33D3
MNSMMEYLPRYYWDIKEFQEMTKVETKKFEQLERDINQLENDQFILTSSEAAIARREAMFGIIPDPTKETLEYRKQRLLSRMQGKPPYIIHYLKRVLKSLLGENDYQINLDIIHYQLDVEVKFKPGTLPNYQERYYKELSNLLDRVVPLNMKLSLTHKRKIEININYGGFISVRKRTTITPIKFTMPNLNLDISRAGFISTRTRTTIKPEVIH